MFKFLEQMSKIVRKRGGTVEGLQVVTAKVFLRIIDRQPVALLSDNLQLVVALAENKSFVPNLRW